MGKARRNAARAGGGGRKQRKDAHSYKAKQAARHQQRSRGARHHHSGRHAPNAVGCGPGHRGTSRRQRAAALHRLLLERRANRNAREQRRIFHAVYGHLLPVHLRARDEVWALLDRWFDFVETRDNPVANAVLKFLPILLVSAWLLVLVVLVFEHAVLPVLGAALWGVRVALTYPVVPLVGWSIADGLYVVWMVLLGAFFVAGCGRPFWRKFGTWWQRRRYAAVGEQTTCAVCLEDLEPAPPDGRLDPGGDSGHGGTGAAAAGDPRGMDLKWACSVCTFINDDPRAEACSMCGTPRAAAGDGESGGGAGGGGGAPAVIELACGHRFHTCCVKPWVEMRGTCPLCRSDVRL